MLLLAIVLLKPTMVRPESSFLWLSLILACLTASARGILWIAGRWEAGPLFQGFYPRQRACWSCGTSLCRHPTVTK